QGGKSKSKCAPALKAQRTVRIDKPVSYDRAEADDIPVAKALGPHDRDAIDESPAPGPGAAYQIAAAPVAHNGVARCDVRRMYAQRCIAAVSDDEGSASKQEELLGAAGGSGRQQAGRLHSSHADGHGRARRALRSEQERAPFSWRNGGIGGAIRSRTRRANRRPLLQHLLQIILAAVAAGLVVAVAPHRRRGVRRYHHYRPSEPGGLLSGEAHVGRRNRLRRGGIGMRLP